MISACERSDLEKDLRRRIHLENNVLFPQAIEFESEIFGEDDDTCGQPAGT